ncbi:VIT domain-containing protein [Haloferula chungangensis]|uniref:VIT domain-containing protein n=1 Tax=Haloferula chungangensis TaxID=1048331 RepID=A0ABW2LD00_9BACT
MKTWTKQAEERLAEYLEAKVRREGLEGGDAREMKEDLSAHIHEEVQASVGDQVGTEDLERVLGRLEDGVPVVPEEPGKRDRGRKWLLFFGVIFPVLVSVFEIAVGFCGAVFFDPVPTFWHAGLVLSLPALNLWLLLGGRNAGSRIQGVAVGAAVTIAAIYALFFIPLLPLSAIALIAWGMGMLSLMPLLAWISSVQISKRVRARTAQPWQFRQGWRIGMAAVLALMIAMEGPGVWTRYQLSRAISEDTEIAESGVSKLRSYHLERTLLRACYEGNRGTSMATDISGWITKGWRIPAGMLGRGSFQQMDSEKTRDVFFLATGKSFNSVEPPRMVKESSVFGGRGRAFEEFEFDDHLGGDSVAVRLKDLDLAESRFDGHIDGLSQIGYGEWTMVFKNGSAQAKEARCQVRLPRGGRVSRLTLWVNGEPREAAFSSVDKVKAAYREIAVVQRRDPVLVTVAGPDTVIVQCFPVPAHGEMKIRFGITASLDGDRWELPRVVERNYGVKRDAEHSLWIQADRKFEISGGPEMAGAMVDGDAFSTQATLTIGQTLEERMSVRLADVDEEPATVWCEDGFADAGGKYLERKTRMGMRPAVDKLVVVVDGSASLKSEASVIRGVLERYPNVEVLIADDKVVEVSGGDLTRHGFSGGRNNEPALRKAVSMAKEGTHGAVVWLHGPQAVELGKSEALLQLLERGSSRPKIYDVEVVAGPNRLSSVLGKEGVLERGPAIDELGRDLDAFLFALIKGGPEVRAEWRRAADSSEMEGQKVWNHLARVWAIERSQSGDPERPKIAAMYQLVTPVSGAVVLETMEQFKRHGLTPVDADAAPSIPGVPEPSTSLLILIGASAALLRRRRMEGGEQ